MQIMRRHSRDLLARMRDLVSDYDIQKHMVGGVEEVIVAAMVHVAGCGVGAVGAAKASAAAEIRQLQDLRGK